MKSRIIRFLKELGKPGEFGLKQELCVILGITSSELEKRAADALSDILHQYGRFSVVTIDSFFHQVIRSFTREMGLQGTFSIDLDIDKVLQQVIDQMLLEIGEPEQRKLRSWLTEFAEQKVEEGQSWDFRRDIATLSKEILADEFRNHADAILELSNRPDYFHQLRKELNQIRFAFESQLKKQCQEVFDHMNRNSLSVKDFKSGNNGPAGLFAKLHKLDLEVSAPRRAAIGDPEKWLTKANLKQVNLVEALENHILPAYEALISYMDRQLIRYLSALEILRYLYTFGILSEINKYLQKYRDENDVMLIADLPSFLHQIIRDSDTPYIYEKVGNVYHHYLIDEFQDTSAFQWDNFMPLVKNTTDEGNFSMVVGDVKQSIYRFRGGEWELLQHRLKEDIGAYHVAPFTLDTNWRSDPEIIRFNNAFFVGLRDFSLQQFLDSTGEILDENIRATVRSLVASAFETFADVPQKIPSHKTESKGAVRFEFISEEDTEEDESWTAEAVKRTIAQVEELQRKGYELRDIAILTRNKGEGKRMADAFIEHRNSDRAQPDLRYEVVSSEALFLTSSHLVRFIVSLIRWLNDEKNSIVLCEWLYEYQRYILKSAVSESAIFSSHELWRNQVPPAFLKQKEYFKTLPLYELVEQIIAVFDLTRLREEYTYLQGFQDAVLDYSKNERGDIPSFLQWWEEVRKDRAIQISDDNNAIKILTIHKSKGLEFPVVILPFLGWSFDHDAFQDNVLWCQTRFAGASFELPPIVPLKYSSKLVNTYWAEDYYRERLKAYLDNLNLLYVAFTRAANVLIGYAKLPKPNAKPGYAFDLVRSQVQQMVGWDESANVYIKGLVTEPADSTTSTVEYGLSQYLAYPWRGKVSIQIKGSAELNEAAFSEASRRGTHLHQLLSGIRHREDLDQYRALEEWRELAEVVEHPSIAGWFDARWEVSTEVPILLPNGAIKRIDRINRSKNEIVIIDFKSGNRRDKDLDQVREYKEILSEMGYTDIKGYLIYLVNLTVVEV